MGKVMIMAGGTGGHVIPALAVAEVLGAQGHDCVWLGTRRGLEARLVPAAGIPMEWLPVEGLRGTGAARKLRAPWVLGRALWAARQALRRHRPGVVLGMGGFASGPGGLMAHLQGLPLVVHEQNRIPGLTNRLLARWADRLLEAFPGSFDPHLGARACGNPVRPGIEALPSPGERFAGRSGPLRLLVLGGSQGARALNRTLPQALARIPGERRPQVLHQTGERQFEACRAAYAQAGVTAELRPFLDDMAAAYGWADLALARAGALTLSELAAGGLGAILVPYPYAVDDHQTRNAAWLTEAGAARLLPEAGLGPEALADLLASMDRATALEMAEAARTRHRPGAAAAIADACREVMAS